MARISVGWNIQQAKINQLVYAAALTVPSISLFVIGGQSPAHSTLCQDCGWPQWAGPARED